MSLLDRLKYYIEHLQLSVSQFADSAQIPRPTLSQILSGRNKKISNEVLTKLHDAFPELNISWLLFGDGPMCLNDTYLPKPSPSPDTQLDSSAPQLTEQPSASAPNLQPSLFQEEKTITEEKRAEPNSHQPIAITPDVSKRVVSIMVFYSDNSFESFVPSKK